jgi:ketosteroid isomerase-like protein
MWTDDLIACLGEDHRALDALVSGDPEPKKRLFSRRDDVTLANPFGPPVCGWAEVARTLERVATLYRRAEPKQFERISGYATAELAYIMEIERNLVELAGGTGPVAVALRVTTIVRREEAGWRVAHCHADPITTARPAVSIVQESDW